MKIVIIAATFWEMRSFIARSKLKSINGKNYFNAEKNLWLRISGIGFQAAAEAAQEALKFNPQNIICTGFAGSLRLAVRAGDLVLDVDKSSSRLSEQVQSVVGKLNLKLHCGATFCSKKTLSSAQEKQLVAAQTSALAVEMESVPIAEICAQKGIAFLSLRAISDELNQTIPECIAAIDPFGKLNLSWFFHLLGCPSQWKNFLHLIFTSKKAEKSLTKFLQEYISACL